MTVRHRKVSEKRWRVHIKRSLLRNVRLRLLPSVSLCKVVRSSRLLRRAPDAGGTATHATASATPSRTHVP